MVRRLLLLVLIAALVAAGVGALVVGGRGPVRAADREVEARWADLRGPLGTRYTALAQLPVALGGAGVGDRDPVVELDAALGRWRTVAARGDDPGAEVAAANELEGLAARIRADVAGSPRLSADAGVTAALAAFDSAVVPAESVTTFAAAARRYQKVRTGWLRRPAALAFDFGPVPVLVLGRAGNA